MAALAQLRIARIECSEVSNAMSNRHCRAYNINLHEPSAIAHWCRHFDTTPQLLIDAVKKVGTNPAIVRLQLRRK